MMLLLLIVLMLIWGVISVVMVKLKHCCLILLALWGQYLKWLLDFGLRLFEIVQGFGYRTHHQGRSCRITTFKCSWILLSFIWVTIGFSLLSVIVNNCIGRFKAFSNDHWGILVIISLHIAFIIRMVYLTWSLMMTMMVGLRRYLVTFGGDRAVQVVHFAVFRPWEMGASCICGVSGEDQKRSTTGLFATGSLQMGWMLRELLLASMVAKRCRVHIFWCWKLLLILSVFIIFDGLHWCIALIILNMRPLPILMVAIRRCCS